MILRIFLTTILITKSYAEFSDRGMLPQGYEWRECRVGMVIQCRIEECDSVCASNLAQEKAQEESQREVTLEGAIDKLQEEDHQEKNPALYQLQQ